jgi:hypothetical protein
MTPDEIIEALQELLHSVTTVELVDQSPNGDGQCIQIGYDQDLEVMVDLHDDGQTLRIFVR